MKNPNTSTKDLPIKETVKTITDPTIIALIGRAFASRSNAAGFNATPVTTNDAEYVPAMYGDVLTVSVRPNPFRLSSQSSRIQKANFALIGVNQQISDVQAHIEGIEEQVKYLEGEKAIPGVPADKVVGLNAQIAGASESIAELSSKKAKLEASKSDYEAELDDARSIVLADIYDLEIDLSKVSVTY